MALPEELLVEDIVDLIDKHLGKLLLFFPRVAKKRLAVDIKTISQSYVDEKIRTLEKRVQQLERTSKQ